MSQQDSILGPYLQPGTRIKVGQYSTKIVKYLSEGGFSHVYIARLDIPVRGSDIAVLKRIVAPDKTALAAIRTEVETMKRLKGHRYIVTYIDSHASALKTGFEVYVLMEYCPGGGLIDFMNTRLQTRLAEWEVLKIISDTAEAVACMHYLRPPLLHRDLKIENVLISGDGCYKLCDFGSCTEPRAAATNSQERRALEEDIQKNTTIQYRSPEMVDVTRSLPIDEKSDIWALGVLLYKLCYFTTPFEAQGQLAILNAAYTFPPYPPYTDRTKRLIAVTLQENPRDRPNIYQLVAEICSMRNVPVPIKDIYSKTRSRPTSRPPPSEDVLKYEEPKEALPVPEINPMRRGRPDRSSSPSRLNKVEPITPKSKATTPIVTAVDEFSTKFPSLEEMDFALKPEASFKFDERSGSPPDLIKPSAMKARKIYQNEQNLNPYNEVSKELKPKKSFNKSTAIDPKTTSGKRESYELSEEPLAKPKDTYLERSLELGDDSRTSYLEKPKELPYLPKEPIHYSQARPLPSKPLPLPKPIVSNIKQVQEALDRPVTEDLERTKPLDMINRHSLEAEGAEREFKAPTRPSGLRRSVSVNSTNKHSSRPSLSHIPSFSGAAKTIMSGKFGDAFRKFEKKPASSTVPLEVEEADLPDHVTQHMRTAEARRSSSYSRSRASVEIAREEDTPNGVKEAMRLLQEKASQTYIPQRSAQGYGKYTDGIQRASTVIPTSRPPPMEKPKTLNEGKNARRYALPVDDEDFTKRYPSVSDFKV